MTAVLTISQALALALEHQQAGRLSEAEDVYNRILAAQPRQPDALHRLGVVHYACQRPADGVRCIAQAVAAQPGQAEFHEHLGVGLRRLGHDDRAAAAYRRALALNPSQVGAWFNHANLLSGPAAVPLLIRAVTADPAFHQGWEALVAALTALGRGDEAVERCRAAAAAAPWRREHAVCLATLLLRLGRHEAAAAEASSALARWPDAWELAATAGLALYYLGRLERAATAWRRVVALRPDLSDGYGNLGTVLHGRLHPDAAVVERRCIRLSPAVASAHANLGVMLQAGGRAGEALACQRRALALQPGDPGGWSNAGAALAALGRFEEAIAAYHHAAALDPGNADPWVQIGSAWQNCGRVAEMLAAFDQALAIDPASERLHNAYGNACLALGRPQQAEAWFRRAVSHNPAFAEAWNNLGAAHRNQGRQEAAVACFHHALAGNGSDHRIHSNLLLTLCYVDGLDEDTLFAEHRAWGRRHADPFLPARPVWAVPRDPERCLTVGYVSPDLRRHAAAYYLEPLFRHHDHGRFRIVAYAEVASPDATTERLRGLTDGWVSTVGLSDDDLAARIRADGVDVLVDCAGHTGNNRLLAFARKPAPVQVTYMGYATTTGMAAMDYMISDPWMIPPDTDTRHYVERIWHLPEVLRCYSPPPESPAVGPLPALSRGGHLTFASFNAFVKITPTVIALWARVLKAVPDSTLLVVSDAPPADVHARFAAHGIGPERLRPTGRLKLEDYLALHNQVDIALDPFPHTGATTTFHSLWMGVPVVSYAGRRFSERATLGILGPLGLAGLASDTLDGYVDLAVRLAARQDELAALRAGLRSRMENSAFIDAALFTRHIEEAYRGMWRRFCGAPPDGVETYNPRR